MRSQNDPVPTRRDRRTARTHNTRRTAFVAAGLAVGILTTAGFAATPASQAEASGTEPDFVLASFTTPVHDAPAAATAVADAPSVEAHEAITAGDATLAAARVLAADIEASGLDLGRPDTSIDTADLEVSLQRLSNSNDVVKPFLPRLTENLTTLAATVDARVADLRGALDEAKARKAAEEAAEKARLEAEAAAKAAAEKAAAEKAAAEKAAAGNANPAKPAATAPRGSSTPIPAPTGGGDNSPGGAQATARSMMAANYGWGEDQFSCLQPLWQRESGWNYRAYNAGSGAYGIPQALPGSKMASAGADWQTNAGTQIAWGLGYISGRYGTPCGAWAHSQSTGWY